MKRYILAPMVLLSSMVHADFDFGECSGSGTFEQQIIQYAGDYENAITVGEIPAGIQGLKVSLTSDNDVDIRLYGENQDKIVHWPYGILSKSTQMTKPYQDVNVTYSGYNGIDGEKGHEFIEVEGTTPTTLSMKAFGYQAGYATVNYSWTGTEGCDENSTSAEGSGSFTQEILAEDTILVGTIPPNIENLQINLTSEKDLDIQLYGEDGTAIVSWQPQGLLFGAGQQTINYKDMNITWSGYNGTDNQAGNEYITISGLTSEMLVMKVYGYEAGEANVTYSWGTPITQDTDNAIILAYAEENSNQVPTIQNYLNIGFTERTINEQTIEEVNTIISNSDIPDIDTFTELLDVVSQTSACLSREELDTMISNEENLSEVNTECITDMSWIFYDRLIIQDLSKWNVSNVTDMTHMFERTLISVDVNFSNWDVKNVTNMSHMFERVAGSMSSITKWDVKNVTDMSYMFSVAPTFNQNIGDWNVSNVTDMNHMFYAANNFNQNIKDWDVSHVTDMSWMFYGFNIFEDNPNGVSFNQNINTWDVSQVTNMRGMFAYTTVFNQNINDWNVSNVVDMSKMFYMTKEFNQDIGSWDTKNVINMSEMFKYASTFNQNIGEWKHTSQVTDMNSMFYGAENFNQPIEKWNVSNVENMYRMFCRTTTFNQPLEKWNVSNVENMSAMFSSATAFNQPLEKWNVSNVENMSGMFYGAIAFNQPIENWIVSNVINMYHMFYSTSSFKNHDLRSWDVNNVTDHTDFLKDAGLGNTEPNWND